ncbi:MAG: prepilin peptidase [Chloroflexi bacterium]|nr:MAG: prepilin peptidase [Chloroflexota bacterium]
MEIEMIVVAWCLAGLFGGALGSFAGVVASRGWQKALRGRSHCDVCGRELEWFELVPLLSFIALRGRCRTCGSPVAWRVYGWEVAGAALGLCVAIPLTLTALR